MTTHPGCSSRASASIATITGSRRLLRRPTDGLGRATVWIGSEYRSYRRRATTAMALRLELWKSESRVRRYLRSAIVITSRLCFAARLVDWLTDEPDVDLALDVGPLLGRAEAVDELLEGRCVLGAKLEPGQEVKRLGGRGRGAVGARSPAGTRVPWRRGGSSPRRSGGVRPAAAPTRRRTW